MIYKKSRFILCIFYDSNCQIKTKNYFSFSFSFFAFVFGIVVILILRGGRCFELVPFLWLASVKDTV